MNTTTDTTSTALATTESSKNFVVPVVDEKDCCCCTSKSTQPTMSPTSSSSAFLVLEENEEEDNHYDRSPPPPPPPITTTTPPSSNSNNSNNNKNKNNDSSSYRRPCLGHHKQLSRRLSETEILGVGVGVGVGGASGRYLSLTTTPTIPTTPTTTTTAAAAAAAYNTTSSSSAASVTSYKSSSQSKLKNTTTTATTTDSNTSNATTSTTAPNNKNNKKKTQQQQQQQQQQPSSSSTTSNNNSNSNSNNSPCLTMLFPKWTRIHETPIALLCILLFVVMCGSAIVVCIAMSQSKVETQQQEALDLAIETGEWFSNQLDQAILPLFSIAQFTHHLDLFQSLPDKIGQAYQPGSLPFINNTNSNNSNEPSFHRNVTGVCDDPELVSRFISIASGVKKMANMDGILVNIQLAPYGVVCLLHPMNNTEDFKDTGQFLDNTGAWGLDLFEHPNFKYIATQNIQQTKVGIAGPLRLIQCPLCDPFFIARLPIVDETHMISADGGKTYYPRWGFATALIDWSKLVKKSGIYESFITSEFEFQLTRTDQNLNHMTGEYEESTVVLAQSFNFHYINDNENNDNEDNDGNNGGLRTSKNTIPRHTGFVSTTLETTNNEWIMTVQYDTSTISIWLAGVITASIVLSFCVSYLIYLVLKQKQIHSEMSADTQTQQAMITTERNITAYFAHELRNPLSALDNALTTLRCGDNDIETTQELLDGMYLCTTFMSSIMNNLLDVRKIEEGHMTIRNQPISLITLLEDSHRMMKAGVRDGVTFQIDTSKLSIDKTWVNADSHRIQQVLSNVLSNAIKYTLEGSITLTVSWVNNNNKVQFECIDTGPGIPKGEQEKLFERFVQRGGAPGTGLGLNIAKQIIELMSGTIEFVSDPTIKPGTTCRIIVPLDVIDHHREQSSTTSPFSSSQLFLQQSQQQQNQSHHQSKKEEGINMNGHCSNNGRTAPTSSSSSTMMMKSSSSGSTSSVKNENSHPHHQDTKKRQEPNNNNKNNNNVVIVQPAVQESISILIMDDIKMNRTMLKRRLQKAVAPNAAYTLVSTGEEALEVCKHQTFDIIICDQYMDDAGGVLLGTDTIIAMRREGINSFIVGCSGNDLTDDFIHAGADIVWAKPIPRNDVIIAQFKDALQRSATRKRF